MAHTHAGLYSWYNKTLNKAFYFEDKELLENQRYNLNQDCVNIESDRVLSKKQRSKGPSKALQSRVHKNIIKNG